MVKSWKVYKSYFSNYILVQNAKHNVIDKNGFHSLLYFYKSNSNIKKRLYRWIIVLILCQCHKTSKNVGEHHPQSKEDQGAGNGIKDAINGIYHGRTACTSSILVLTLMVIHSILGTSPVAGNTIDWREV